MLVPLEYYIVCNPNELANTANGLHHETINIFALYGFIFVEKLKNNLLNVRVLLFIFFSSFAFLLYTYTKAQ